MKWLTGTDQVADRRLSRGCVCVYQSAEWALVKGLTGTDLVVDQALNDHPEQEMIKPLTGADQPAEGH